MSLSTKKAVSVIDVLPKYKLLKSPKFSALNSKSIHYGYGACSASDCNCKGDEGSGQTCENCGHKLRQTLVNSKRKTILTMMMRMVKKLGDGTGKFNLRNSHST